MKAALLAAMLTSTQILAAPTTVATRAVNTLGIELLAKTSEPDQNALLSPYSIQSALAMTYAGADGTTRAEMMKALHYPTNEMDLHDSFSALSKALEIMTRQQSGPISLVVANRLFGQSGYEFRPAFLDLSKEKYNAALEPLDFARNSIGSTKRINDWVETQTHGRIANVIPNDLDPMTRLVLVNAIYFKAPWADPFDESSTKPQPFHLLDGTEANVPTMVHSDDYGYAVRDGYSVITLPYAIPIIQFLILLPNKADGLPALEARLPEILLASPPNVSGGERLLFLPKFKLEPASISLKSALQLLGMKSAFSRESANFDRMAPRQKEDLFVSEVFHKSFINVDEQGTEAAAATTALVDAATGIERPSAVIHVDHPFLFVIQHRPSGACLFLGRVVDPR